MENTKLPKCVVVGEADKGSTGEAEKQWMRLIAAQEADKWYKTVKHGAERAGAVII